MEKANNLFWLQIFGEGAGAGGEGGATGVSSGDAGQADNSVVSDTPAPDDEELRRQRLMALGVPEGKLPKGKAKAKAAAPAPAAKAAPETTAQTPETETEDQRYDNFMKDPAMNSRVQAMIQARLKSEQAKTKEAADKVQAMLPAIELMASRYNLEMGDGQEFFDALNNAINNDNDFYREKALELGVDVETAKKLDQNERDNDRRRKAEEDALARQQAEERGRQIADEARACKAKYPNFDLATEWKNDVFRDLVSSSKLPVEAAYVALHRDEILTNVMRSSAETAQTRMANAVRSGSVRPVEAGSPGSAQAVPIQPKMNKQRMNDIIEEMSRRRARGEKLYPGQI